MADLLRKAGLVFAGFLALPLFYFLASLLGAIIPAGEPTHSPFFQPVHKIGLVGGPIHYDIAVPLDEKSLQYFGWAGQDMPLDHPNVRWLVIGWGARDFYTTTGRYQDINVSATIKAITGDQSVMHIALASDLPQGVRWLYIPQANYERLLGNMMNSFRNGPQSQPIMGGDFNRFYPAKGRFHIFNTCNVWVGRMLRDAGVRFGIWTPTPQAISLSHWLHHP